MVKEIKRSKKKMGKQKYRYSDELNERFLSTRGEEIARRQQLAERFEENERAQRQQLEDRFRDGSSSEDAGYKNRHADEVDKAYNARLLMEGEGVDTVYRRKYPKKKSKRRVMLWPKRSKTRRVLYLAKKPKRTIGKQKYQYNGLNEERIRNIKARQASGRWIDQDEVEELEQYDASHGNKPVMDTYTSGYEEYERRTKRKRVHKKGLTWFSKKTKKKRNIVW
jgi:hypothetical protein